MVESAAPLEALLAVAFFTEPPDVGGWVVGWVVAFVCGGVVVVSLVVVGLVVVMVGGGGVGDDGTERKSVPLTEKLMLARSNVALANLAGVAPM